MLTAESVLADAAGAAVEAKASTNAANLAQLLSAFNEVSARVTRSHEALVGEVTRLKAELAAANEQLRRSEQLAALGEMAAGIAHEIRNPLGSIQLYAGMLVEDLGDRPAQLEIAEKIGRAVRGLNGIVNDVLAFSREIKVRPVEISAGELLNGAVESCMALVEEAEIVVDGPDEKAWKMMVCCDPALIRLALTNIVRNAVEALAESEHGDRGLIVLAAEAHRSRSSGREPVVRLVVRDTGPGVPDDVLGRMFNPFFTTRQTGTGLGLAIVHRIVDAHDGDIAIHNREEAPGAEVEVTLPQRFTQRDDRENMA
jgi:signal transduction histidine kinase